MKAVLMSIQPKWCELIASGKKTVEVRKNKPKLETPFKVYIYETQGRTETPFVDEEGHHIFKGRGQVIGEFVCDRIDYWQYNWLPDVMHIEDMSELSCVSVDDLLKYSNNAKDTLYGWHITDLVIYDEQRELGEFRSYNVRAYFDEKSGLPMPTHEITRPPQSWCYCEEVNDGN